MIVNKHNSTFYQFEEEDKEFINKQVHDVRDRLHEVYGETLPRELDEQIGYIVSETFRLTMMYAKKYKVK